MDINRLRSDELTWELKIRGAEIGSTVDQKRMQLRNAIQEGLPLLSNMDLNPLTELNICSVKLDELIGKIQTFDNSNRVNEFKKIHTRLLHISGRLERILVPPELQLKKENLQFLLNGAFEALIDADHIASLVTANFSVTNKSQNQNQPNTSTYFRKEDPPVANLIQLNEDQEERLSENVYRVEDEPSPNTVQVQCARLSETLNRMVLQPYPMHPRDQSRRVSFLPGQDTRAEPEPIVNRGARSSTNFQNLNSTPFDSSGVSVMQNYCHKNYVPVQKLGVSFDGTGSVISFLEEVEQLSESRGITSSQVFHSVYELLRGDARDWYLPRKHGFIDWEDFKMKLKDAFMPINYEENLLEDIQKRTQGSDERVMLYITRMQNLFRRLSTKRPTETEQVRIIRRNLLPSLQVALSFQEANTIEDLLSKCRELEQIHWQAQQYCPPPTQLGLVQEPHLSYRRTTTNRHVQVKAIETDNTGPVDSNRTASNKLEKKPRKCFNCNQPGHLRANCPQPRKLTCFKCGLDGYTVKNCANCTKNVPQGS